MCGHIIFVACKSFLVYSCRCKFRFLRGKVNESIHPCHRTSERERKGEEKKTRFSLFLSLTRYNIHLLRGCFFVGHFYPAKVTAATLCFHFDYHQQQELERKKGGLSCVAPKEKRKKIRETWCNNKGTFL